MKKILIAVLTLLIIVSSAACAASSEKGVPSQGVAPAPVPAPAPQAPSRVSTGSADSANGGMLSGQTEERKIIRNGAVSLVVKDVSASRDQIAALAVQLGGFVVSSYITGSEANIRGQISFRVPDEQFEPALAGLRKLSVRVISEQTTSQDVTEEYTDLQARLKVAEATEAQYLALLDRANSVEEILKIYDYLSRVRAEIEQLKGRIQYLERSTSMSLINVNLQPEASVEPLVKKGWNVMEIFKSAIRGLVTMGQVLATIAIWLVVLIPIWGTVLGIIIWRRRRKKSS